MSTSSTAPLRDNKKLTVVVNERKGSDDSIQIKTPRTPRFAEATAVHSPAEPRSRTPFNDPEEQSMHFHPQAQPSDVGFGYIGSGPDRSSGVEMPMTPKTPLKSALKSPGAPPRNFEQVLSPTFREEIKLEKEEKKTEKQQKKDLAQKVRVRMAKLMLRMTNFSCSLIVVSMLTATFSIFNATKTLPARNNLPAWSGNTIAWPQITLLSIAAVSLAASFLVLWANWRGGHRRAEKTAVYYSTFAVVWFVFSIVMWVIGAAVLQQARSSSNGQDIWGWSCADNERKALFQDDVQYDLVCRMQNWSLVCSIIEIVVELITIMIYGIVFFRFYSKRKLRKSMAARDRARSDLYLATLRAQSAPNTPGAMSPRFGAPMSPRDGGYNPMYSPRFANAAQEKSMHQAGIDELSMAEQGTRFVTASSALPAPAPFQLQAPPIKKPTPKMQQGQFSSPTSISRPATPAHPQEAQQVQFQQARQVSVGNISVPPSPMMSPGLPVQSQPIHHAAAPGEKQYDAVPIPGAFGSPMTSPQFAPPQAQFFGQQQPPKPS